MQWRNNIRIFIYTAISGFASGVFLRSFFDIGWPSVLFLAFLGVVGVVLYFTTTQSRFVIFSAVVLFGAAIGVLRFDISERFVDHTLNAHVGTEMRLLGTVVEEPDERETNTQLTISVEQAQIGDRILEVDTKVLAFTEHFPEYAYGDSVLLFGELAKPEAFETDTGRTFDYKEFLEKDGIYYQMFYPNISLVAEDQGNPVKGGLFALKNALLFQIQKHIAEPQGALLGGLLVGVKQSLGDDLLDAFRATGIIHIVVLSGYNVTIVAEAIMRFFAFAPMRTRIFLGAASILGFMVMVGAGATVVRASVMALLVMLARVAGRMYDIGLALAVAGFIMVFINPKILAFDPSFQLSFLATIGLIYLVPVLESKLNFVPRGFQLKEFALATIATQIFVLPLLLYMIGEFSLVAVAVNMLVLIIVPATMFFGFITGVTGFVSGAVASAFGFLTYLLLTYILSVVEIFASLPFASVIIPPFPAFMMIVLYAILMYWIWNARGRYTLTRPDAVGGNDNM